MVVNIPKIATKWIRCHSFESPWHPDDILSEIKDFQALSETLIIEKHVERFSAFKKHYTLFHSSHKCVGHVTSEKTSQRNKQWEPKNK